MTYKTKKIACAAFRSRHPAQAADLTDPQLLEQGYVDEDEPGVWVINNPEDNADEDDFEAGMAEELAAREAAAKQAEGHIDEAEHPMMAGKRPSPAPAPDKPKAQRAPSGNSNGLKIELNRPTQNGVTRPSAGGKCRAVWDMLDAIGPDATAKQARAAAEEHGFDKTTTMVQFYRWRKFNGYVAK